MNRVDVVEEVAPGVPAHGRPCRDGDRRHGVPITCVDILCATATHSLGTMTCACGRVWCGIKAHAWIATLS